MAEEWKQQIRKNVKTIEQLEQYINLSDSERTALKEMKTIWGVTPYFAELMDKNDPNCPIRKQVIPSLQEKENVHGMQDYLIWKENRATEEKRPDSIARQYKDKIAFTVIDKCGIYCRHCFRKEVILGDELNLRFDVDEGLEWIAKTPEIRDVLVTGGDPLLLSDDKLAYLIGKLREIPHVEMIRIGSRLPIVLPHRITPGLLKVLGGQHRVPIWLNTQCNHPKEITDLTAKAVFDLLSAGVNVGNQTVLMKGINDDVDTFRTLNQKLLSIRIRPYYLFYCEAAPGIDHFRTPIEKGAELIRDALRGHTTGLAQPMYVVATNIGKIPLMPDYNIVDKNDEFYTLRNHKGETTRLPTIRE